jgi:DNA-binding transcriptional MerR regulator
VRISTREVAKLLGIELATLRLLMREGKIKAPPFVFDSTTHSTGRTWSEDDIERARKVLQSIKGA